MPDPIDLITADPDTDNPDTFNTQAVLAWEQLIARIPQMNAAFVALNLNDLSDTSTSSNTINLTAGKTFEVSASKGFVKGGYLMMADNAAPTTNFMVVQTVSYSSTTLTVDPVKISGSGTKTDWVISFAAPPLTAVVDNFIHVISGNGHGSTKDKFRRFTTTVEDTGTAITYADSSTNGASFTAEESGIYAIYYSDGRTTSVAAYGITKNQVGTTSVASLDGADMLGLAYADGVGKIQSASVVVKLDAADVINAHTDGNPNDTSAHRSIFHMRKIADV